MIENLTLDQLRVLIAVAETGSFSGAARRLGRVQSAVSQAVQTLEATLGLPVFDRSGRTPVLNEAGSAILGDARRLVDGARALRARVADMAAGLEPDLPVAVDSIFPVTVLADTLRAVAARYESLAVTVFTEGLGGPESRLREGVVRLAIGVHREGPDTADLDTEFLTRVQLVPVVAACHPLAARPGPLAPADLQDEVQLVLTDRTPLTRHRFGGILSRRIWRFADMSTRLEFLLGGFGWCNMPRHMVEGHIAAGRLATLAITGAPPASLPLHILKPRDRPLGQASRWFVADLRRRLDQCPGHFGAL